MTPILIYGFPSGSSMGLVAALDWSGLPHRLCRVDMLGEMREPAYGRLNPRHETPVLITEGGRVLTETMAICAWIEARDTARRVSFPPASPEADRMHQMQAFLNTGFTAAFGPLWAVLEMETPDPERQAALRGFGRDAVIERHDRLEEMVGREPFLVGHRPTLADGVLVGVARWLDFHEVADRRRWPQLDDLRRRLEELPAVVRATALEAGKEVSDTGPSLGHVSLAEVIERFGHVPGDRGLPLASAAAGGEMRQ